MLRNLVVSTVALFALAALAGPAASVASPAPSVLTLKTVKVGAPGNPSVGVVPFKDAIYESCDEAAEIKPPCQEIGGVKYRYGIGQLEVTVDQWVAFLNTADPAGSNRHKLYSTSESSSAWPKFGQVNFSAGAAKGHHYTVASPEWADKPYGFANFLRSARFTNSLYNGRLLSKKASSEGAFSYVTYRVRLSRKTESGMYEMTERAATRSHKTGFVIPSQDEWIKAAYYDPGGGGEYSYWKYPTNAGVFGDGTATAPHQSTLDPTTGEVTNSATQPLATFHAAETPAPSWCPAAVGTEACAAVNPFGIDPTTYASIYQGSLGTVGAAKTTSPWGDPRPGRQRRRVDRHDHAAAIRRRRASGLAPPARRHRQRPRLPALALGSRPAAAGQHPLHRHLSLARHPDRDARQPQAAEGLSAQAPPLRSSSSETTSRSNASSAERRRR